MLIVCVNAYEEEKNIGDCLQSIIDACRRSVFKIMVVDGAYKYFPHEGGPASKDKTCEIAENLGAEIIPAREWATEQEKRNAYLIGDPGDWYFVVDADERVRGEYHPGDISLRILEKEAYQINLERNDGHNPNKVFRLFKQQPGLQYRGTHHALFINQPGKTEPRLLNSENLPVYPGVDLLHLVCQDLERIKKKGEYYRHLNDAEADFRAEWKL